MFTPLVRLESALATICDGRGQSKLAEQLRNWRARQLAYQLLLERGQEFHPGLGSINTAVGTLRLQMGSNPRVLFGDLFRCDTEEDHSQSDLFIVRSLLLKEHSVHQEFSSAFVTIDSNCKTKAKMEYVY